MIFREVLRELYSGNKMTLPNYNCYWFVNFNDNLIYISDNDNKILPFIKFDLICNRKDWKYYE